METFPSKNISIAWVEKGSLTRNLFLSFGFAILTALSAQIRFELPFTPVPIQRRLLSLFYQAYFLEVGLVRSV